MNFTRPTVLRPTTLWLNRDVANIIKEYSDPLTYGKLLCTAKVFYSNGRMEQQRKCVKLVMLEKQLVTKRHTRLITKRLTRLWLALQKLGV
jgi:hypothetical protein